MVIFYSKYYEMGRLGSFLICSLLLAFYNPTKAEKFTDKPNEISNKRNITVPTNYGAKTTKVFKTEENSFPVDTKSSQKNSFHTGKMKNDTSYDAHFKFSIPESEPLFDSSNFDFEIQRNRAKKQSLYRIKNSLQTSNSNSADVNHQQNEAIQKSGAVSNADLFLNKLNRSKIMKRRPTNPRESSFKPLANSSILQFQDHVQDKEEQAENKESTSALKSAIRHRRSRKSFARLRKTQKLRQNLHGIDHEALSLDYKDDDFESKQRQDEEPHYTLAEINNLEVYVKSDENQKYDDSSREFPLTLISNFTFIPSNASSDINSSGFDQLSVSYWDGEEFRNSSFSEQPRESMDVVTKFLRIIESQQEMGENCTKGTGFNLGEGVVDKYAHERFRIQADLTVNIANLYTRLWKYSRQQVLMSEYLLHAQVLVLLESHEEIFSAGNCYDSFQYPGYELFCPFAHRLPDGGVQVKDLAQQYFYLTNDSEFFWNAKRSGERVIEDFSQLRKGKIAF